MSARRLVRVGVHLVWGTKHRIPWLDGAVRARLDPLLRRTLIWKRCDPIAVGGWVDHVHVYALLGPMTTLSALVVALKSNSARWIRESSPGLECFQWQRGYAAFGVDPRDDAALRAYIRDQELIHSMRAGVVSPMPQQPQRRAESLLEGRAYARPG